MCYNRSTMKSGEIRELRRSMHLTQREFAKMLEVAISTVGRWEIGQTAPSPLALSKLNVLREKGSHR